MPKKIYGLLFLLVAVFAWGPAPVFTKIALTEIPEFPFVFLSRIIAVMILLLIFAPRGELKIKKQDIPMFVLAGLTGSVFNVGFFVFGIQLTTAMDAQAIFSTAPITTAILAYFVLKEKIKPVQALGVIVGFLGAVLIATRTFFETGTLASGSIFGDLLIFISSISWVFYIMISKKLSSNYSPAAITLYSFIVSTIIFAPIALVTNFNDTSWINGLTIAGISGLLYIGIFASVVAFLAYQIGLKLTSAFIAGVVLYLQPIVTTFVAVPVLGEKITLPFILGAALIIFGSVIATQHHFASKTKSIKSLFQRK